MLNKLYSLFTIYQKHGADFSAMSWELVGTYKGFIQPASGGEGFAQGKSGENATHILYTDVYTPCHYGNQVRHKGQKYIMLYAIQPQGISGTGHHKEIILGIFQ